jgi:hypothetical protein
MRAILNVLRLRRNARRDAALAQVGRARRQADAARAAVAETLAAARQAVQWREELLRGQGPASGTSGANATDDATGAAGTTSWGPGLLDSCEALLLQKLDAWKGARTRATEAEQAVQTARLDLALRERACLRTDELLAWDRAEERRAHETLEQMLEEDLASARRGPSAVRGVSHGAGGQT